MNFSLRNHKWVKDLISSVSSFTQAIAKSDLLFYYFILLFEILNGNNANYIAVYRNILRILVFIC